MRVLADSLGVGGKMVHPHAETFGELGLSFLVLAERFLSHFKQDQGVVPLPRLFYLLLSLPFSGKWFRMTEMLLKGPLKT